LSDFSSGVDTSYTYGYTKADSKSSNEATNYNKPNKNTHSSADTCNGVKISGNVFGTTYSILETTDSDVGVYELTGTLLTELGLLISLTYFCLGYKSMDWGTSNRAWDVDFFGLLGLGYQSNNWGSSNGAWVVDRFDWRLVAWQ
jgi:hypothetical protein